MVPQNQVYISGLMWLLMELIDKLVGLPENLQVGWVLGWLIVLSFLLKSFEVQDDISNIIKPGFHFYTVMLIIFSYVL